MAEIFTETTLPSGGILIMKEGKGLDYFVCAEQSEGDNILFAKLLICRLVKIDGKKITELELDKMDIRDVSYIMEVLSLMMDNNFKID